MQKLRTRMQLGLDSPVSWLHYIQKFADYDYILVEKCVLDKMYLEYFKNSSRDKLINNRLMGTDTSRQLGDIIKVWNILGGQVIAPDWGNNHLRTIDAFGVCAEAVGWNNVIGVVQTLNEANIKECLEIYGDTVAVGFDVGSEHEDDELDKIYRRIKVVRQLKDKKVHLLGMTHPGELLFYRNMPWVVSINTGTPVMLGFKGIRLENYERVKDVSSYNYMDMDYPLYHKDIMKLIEENIDCLRSLL